MLRLLSLLVLLCVVGCGQRARTAAELARIQFGDGEFEAAAVSVEAALKEDPDNYELHQLRGHIKMNLTVAVNTKEELAEILESAIDDFSKAIELAPLKPKPYLHRSDAYRELSKTTGDDLQLKSKYLAISDADEIKGNQLAKVIMPSSTSSQLVIDLRSEATQSDGGQSDSGFSAIRPDDAAEALNPNSVIRVEPDFLNPSVEDTADSHPNGLPVDPTPTEVRPETPFPTDLIPADTLPEDPLANLKTPTLGAMKNPQWMTGLVGDAELDGDDSDAEGFDLAEVVREQLRERREKHFGRPKTTAIPDLVPPPTDDPAPRRPGWNYSRDGRQLYGAGPVNAPYVSPSPYGGGIPSPAATTGISSQQYAGFGPETPGGNLGPAVYGANGLPIHGNVVQFGIPQQLLVPSGPGQAVGAFASPNYPVTTGTGLLRPTLPNSLPTFPGTTPPPRSFAPETSNLNLLRDL